MEDRIDCREVAQLLGMTTSAVCRLAARGTLRYSWFAGRRAFFKNEVLALREDPAYQRRSRRRTLDALLASGAITKGGSRS